MSTQILLNGLLAGIWVSLLATAFVIAYAGSRFFVFTFGIAYLYGAYGMLLFSHVLPLPVAAVMGVLIAAATSILLETLLYRPIRRSRENNLILMLASIGAYVVLQNVVSLIFGDVTRSVRYWDVVEGHSILGARVTSIQLLIAGVSVMVVILVGFLVRTLSFGGRLRAIASDASLARTVGVQIAPTRAWAAGIGGAMAGIAAVLMSLDTDMTPTMGFHALLLAIVACIVGGITSYPGGVLGGLFVGLIMHLGVWKLPAAWQDAILFVVLLLFLFVRPHGFLGKPLRAATV